MEKYIIIGVIVLVILFVILTLNKLIKLKNYVKEAFATMDVYLKKRWDLIPNIVETVKGYAKFENETLKNVVELRSNVNNYDSLSREDKIKTNEKVSQELTKLMALAESYPDLKANVSFLNLQRDLVSVEDEIAQSRKYYNATVRNYNNKVEMVPSNLIAAIFGYKTFNMFEASDDERQNVKVSM